MRITKVSLQRSDGCQELSALLDGQRLWYRVRCDQPLEVRGDPFVIAGLLLAMAAGKDIQVDPSGPVSPQLCEGIRTLQGIYGIWNPRLRSVSINATMEEGLAGSSAAACFFSGGLDGIHTFLRHRDEISALIFIRGIDFTLDNERLFHAAVDSNTRFAARYGKTLLTVETNIRDFGYPNTRIGVTAFYGPILASVARVLAFQRTFIAAGLTYREIGPEGDFPFTWPLWSSERCANICDGAECTRLDKFRFVAAHPGVLDELRICLTNTEYNCNQCEKCLLNRAMLRVLRLASKSLRPLDDPAELMKIRLTDIEGLTFCRQMQQAAEEAGDLALARALQSRIRQYQARQLFWQVDRDFLRGAIRRRWRKSHKTAWQGSHVPPWERLDFKHADD